MKVVQPADFPGIVGIDTMGVMAGSKRADVAYEFINRALSRDIQRRSASPTGWP